MSDVLFRNDIMMNNVLLANAGNRNMSYGGENINKKDFSFWEFTKLLWEDIANEQKNITLNILPEILQGNNIDEVFLFATNQWHHQDTYYEAKIIEYFLRDKYQIHIIEITHNPTKRDDAFQFYQNFLHQHQELQKANIMISGSGGVPAMKEALNFFGVMMFSKITILDVNEFTKEVSISTVDQEYLEHIDKKTFREMIENYDYAWASVFIKQSKISSDIQTVLHYTHNRFNFNFTQCQTIKDHKLPSLPTQEPYELIQELLQNIEVSYYKGEYAMVIAKVFSLYEGLIKYLFSSICCDPEDIASCQKQWLQVSYKWDGSKYIEIKEYKAKVHNNFKSLDTKDQQIKIQMDQLPPLKETRNLSIVAHGFGGISKEDAKQLFDTVRELKPLFAIDKKKNLFDDINTYILSQL